MIVGDPSYRTEAQAKKFRQLTYTCLENILTRSGETLDMPKKVCKAGIMANIRFPTTSTQPTTRATSRTPVVPSRAAVPVPRLTPSRSPLFYEVIWDTRAFNNPNDWPTDGSQPFVWSYGDPTGYGNHGDYMFGWKGDALQKAMDSNCNINCPQLKTQSISQGNQCSKKVSVNEEIDGWLKELPGGMPVTDATGKVLY
ncbi:putative carbohydrate-binding module family 1 protein [Daldinia childiae]|uniref:putative carbohydrate-binding module family 1 protein n=1 Tax=Daldinia childiae TaxID=326645 RepID=UPI00144696C4|nr:putative carbohydrate-binding module family 1 protein [Daldinia childiae]KAF3058524.1 putative carbohydrate-binding module family 1 protein [Daldinia childiae]